MSSDQIEIKCNYKELLSIDKVIPNSKNNNKHPEKQLELLSKLIKNHGFRHPLIISNRSGFLVAGHGRLEAAKMLGMEQVPVDFQDFESEAMEYAFLISDNKIAELAEFDEALMIDELKDLDITDFDLLGIPDFEMPDFHPATIDDQGQLDEIKIKIMECPNCGEKFEEKQAKIID
jgi:hypothetical protein